MRYGGAIHDIGGGAARRKVSKPCPDAGGRTSLPLGFRIELRKVLNQAKALVYFVHMRLNPPFIDLNYTGPNGCLAPPSGSLPASMVGSISLASEVSLLLLVSASNHQLKIKCAKNSLRYPQMLEVLTGFEEFLEEIRESPVEVDQWQLEKLALAGLNNQLFFT